MKNILFFIMGMMLFPCAFAEKTYLDDVYENSAGDYEVEFDGMSCTTSDTLYNVQSGDYIYYNPSRSYVYDIDAGEGFYLDDC